MEQLCGHVVSPARREKAIIEETFSVRSVSGLYKGASSSSQLNKIIINMFAVQDKVKPDIEHIGGLNLAVVKLTTVQVTKLPL
jgi:hypothetical protein